METLIEDLPDEALIKIFQLLDFKSLLKLQTVSTRLFRLSNSNELWKPFCFRFWLITELLSQDNGNWKSCFTRMFLDFGRYIDCYAELKAIWQEIQEITAERVPRINDSLNVSSPLTEAELDDIEKRLDQSLPNDFRCSYRICDGQSTYSHGGLFGGYDEEDPGDLLTSLRSDVSLILDEAVFFFSRNFSTTSSLLPFIGRKNNLGNFIIRPHFFLALFLSKEANNESIPLHGSVVSLQYEQDTKMCEFFVYAKSFQVLLKDHLEKLKTYPIHNGHVLNISMDKAANKKDSCKLDTRHWVITDGNGVVETVDGPGVVGQYPTMIPGARHHWISGTSYNTTVGEMKGHFTMHNLKDGSVVQIVCPTYIMHAPEIVRCQLTTG